MNILYIHTHDSGRMFSPYGYAVPTPNIQNLADEGYTFRQAFCANPTCSPSRAAMLTGQYAHSCDLLALTHRGFFMPDHSHHLSNYLASQGYETVLSGVQHEARIEMLGYEKVLHTEAYHQEEGFHFTVSDRASARQAADFLRQRTDERPFFLSVGFVHTNRHYPPADMDINPNHLRPPEGMPDTNLHRKDMAGLATALCVVDNCVGEVLEALKDAGYDKNTLVMFTTDHGIAYPQRKCTLNDGGIGIALIMRIPGMEKVGKHVDALVSQVDVFPTLCDLAGVTPPAWLEGVSLRPLLEGTADSVRDQVFAEVNYHAAYEPIRCVRTERYKYIRYYDETQSTPVPANIDDGIAKTYVDEQGYLQQKVAREQLYDLALDPFERVNLIDDPAMAAITADLKAKLRNWQEETKDPLLNDTFVPMPAGAKVNVITAYSPKEQDFIYG